jgi:hypothetical protein
MIREQENTNTEDSQYVYLLQTREFINSNLPVYKIGKTKQTNNLRFNSYPKGSKLFVQLCCKDCDECERLIINLFDKKYKKRSDFGNEYYEGEKIKMILDIIEIIDYKKQLEEQEKMKYLQEIENLKKENTELKKEKISIIGKNNDLKTENSKKNIVDSLITEIIEYKEPDNNVEKKGKINKLTKEQYKFSCEKCCYYTDIKFCFENHNKSKTHRKKEKNEFELGFECDICKKKYTSRVGLWKHKKTCKLEKENETKKEKEVISNLVKGILLEIK